MLWFPSLLPLNFLKKRSIAQSTKKEGERTMESWEERQEAIKSAIPSPIAPIGEEENPLPLPATVERMVVDAIHSLGRLPTPKEVAFVRTELAIDHNRREEYRRAHQVLEGFKVSRDEWGKAEQLVKMADNYNTFFTIRMKNVVSLYKGLEMVRELLLHSSDVDRAAITSLLRRKVEDLPQGLWSISAYEQERLIRLKRVIVAKRRNKRGREENN
jgi:hypothetical protein